MKYSQVVLLGMLFTALTMTGCKPDHKAPPSSPQSIARSKAACATPPVLYVLQLRGDAPLLLQNNPVQYLFTDLDEVRNNKLDLGMLRDKGTKVILYFNIGAVEEWRDYSDPQAYRKYGFMDYEGWEGERVATYWQPEYQEMMMGMAQKLAQIPDIDGLIFDNPDNAWTVQGLPKQKQKTLPGLPKHFLDSGDETPFLTEMKRFVGRMANAVRAANPRLEVYTVNGMDSVDPNDVTGIVAENKLPFKNETWFASDVAGIKRFKQAGRKVFLVEYEQPGKSGFYAEAVRFASELGLNGLHMADAEKELDREAILSNRRFYQSAEGKNYLNKINPVCRD